MPVWSPRKVKNTVNAVVAGVSALLLTSIGILELNNGYVGFGLLVMCVGLFTMAIKFTHLAASEAPG